MSEHENWYKYKLKGKAGFTLDFRDPLLQFFGLERRVGYLIQLGSQQLVFGGKCFVFQQQLAVQLCALGHASLQGEDVSLVGKDSGRVTLTQPSYLYSAGPQSLDPNLGDWE